MENLLETQRLGAHILVHLPGLELPDRLVHVQVAHFDPLLQRDELPLPLGSHARVWVVGRGRQHVLDWPRRN